jgi:nucleotide-binding universal stress UspA family protein
VSEDDPVAAEPISLIEARSKDPDLTTPRTEPSRIKTVLLATDLSPASEIATSQAIDLAASIGARLLIVNVVDALDSGLRLDQRKTSREGVLLGIVQRAHRRHTDAEFLLWTGEPGPSIVAAAEAEHADLIVVGTRGLDDDGRYLFGSVSHYVVYHSLIPVLVAH